MAFDVKPLLRGEVARIPLDCSFSVEPIEGVSFEEDARATGEITDNGGYMRLRLHNIIINTQNESSISATFVLRRPGLLIGHSGKDFNNIKELLEKAFNKKVDISIREVKKDVNEPISFDF